MKLILTRRLNIIEMLDVETNFSTIINKVLACQQVEHV